MSKPAVWPETLRELLSPTPSGVAKLLAAWDGLTLELQVQALERISNPKSRFAQHPTYLVVRVLTHALNSTNAYVRYVAAKFLSSNIRTEEVERVRDTINADPNALVRFAQLETDWSWRDSNFSDPARFFKLPHEARLAKVRALTGASEVLAANIKYAIDNLLADGAVTELELYELLSDYIQKPELLAWYDNQESYARQFGDGYAEYSAGKDLEALWAIVPELPESLSVLLINHLPIQAGFSNNLAEQTAKKLPKKLLILLLYRPAGLAKMRKSIFFDKNNSEDLRSAAASHDLDLSLDEFDSMLFDLTPYKKIGLKAPELNDSDSLAKLKDLRILAHFADDLSIAIQHALVDFLRAAPNPKNTLFGGPYEDAGFAQDRLKMKMCERGSLNTRELRDLRIYLLAKGCVSWRPEEFVILPTGPLAFLSSFVDAKSPWGTFVAFKREWERRVPTGSELEQYLPAPPEFGT